MTVDDGLSAPSGELAEEEALEGDLPLEEGMGTVHLPSGAKFYVHDVEVDYINDLALRYMTDNAFQNISDLQDIDRLLTFELICHRYVNWLSVGRDYMGDPINEKELHDAIKTISTEVRALKVALGLDKKSRDAMRGEDSVEHYITQLRVRAKEFGVMRNEQAALAIETFQELIGRLTLMNNCDEREQIEQKCRPKDILDWLVKEEVPKFQKIDEEFRKTKQKYWIRSQ